ncbi:MAG: class I SAM-dependent methyltransferase [Bacteroidota bacterium]
MFNKLKEDTIINFGEEWKYFNHLDISNEALSKYYNDYFSLVDFDALPINSRVFDLGCGSGRWSRFVADKVGTLYCIDPSKEALEIARQNLINFQNVNFYDYDANNLAFEDNFFDFGFSLGVLHHIQDTLSGIKSAVRVLKVGSPFLLYLYFSFDNKPLWYKMIWKLTDFLRILISKLPFRIKIIICNAIAFFIYYPLSRLSKFLNNYGVDTKNFPLNYYKNATIYTMKNDALDRFGTKIEQRFSKLEISEMLSKAGLINIEFSPNPPYWVVKGYKSYT